jgi:hypothetical protein
MPRPMSTSMLVEKNKLESSHPWIYLFQVDIGGVGPYRLAAYDQDITFHGSVYARYPLVIEQMETPTHAALVQMRATVGNVDQILSALLESYWATTANPDWGVQAWEIDALTPDETPVTASEVFTVQQVVTDTRQAVFDLTAEGLTLTASVPKRRYTASSGYLFIPRRN